MSQWVNRLANQAQERCLPRMDREGLSETEEIRGLRAG